MNNDSFDVGILRLNPSQKDIQGPHSQDELYFIIEGEGYITIHEKDHLIEKGMCIFIPANTKHYFYGNKEKLIVLYIFASK
jgi:mannose-6-phosphate isomerase-like protein (cupin superfamily)